MKKLVLLLICILLCGCKQEIEVKNVDLESINNFNYDSIDEFDFDLHCQEYLLVRMSDLKVLYAKDIDKNIYPASLTKLVTLDTVLNYVEDLKQTSSFTYTQLNNLIAQDASLAGLQVNYEYTIEELLYALILPSGADAAAALENYFASQDLDLIVEMNNIAKSLGCENSNFINTTGLHDDNHYSSLNDLFKIVLDVLKFDEGRQILESMRYTTSDDIHLMSSVRFVKAQGVKVLGGKTGYTPESGMSVVNLYKANNRSYILFVANALGDPYGKKEYFHYEDAMEIMEHLY